MKVRIDLDCRVRYRAIHEMSQAEYDRLKNALENGSRDEAREAEEELNEMMSESDYYDGEVEDVMNFLPVKEEEAEVMGNEKAQRS